MMLSVSYSYFFFFNDTATTEIYTLSLHDALPILIVEHHDDVIVPARADAARQRQDVGQFAAHVVQRVAARSGDLPERSEEHTSELQSRSDLVCRLLLEKKKKKRVQHPAPR